MAIERYVVTALPYSVDPRERFHVSLYVAPRLEPTTSESELRAFPLFAAWTDRLAGAEIVLADQTGPLPVKLASATTPGLWQQAFPADTPVRGRTRPAWSDRKWRSFSTRLAEQAAKGIHALSAVASPVETPLPSASPLASVLVAVAREHKLWDGRGAYDETAVTRVLDRLVESPRELAALMRAGGRDAVYALLGEIHRARRFYERPESTQPFQARPTPGATRPRIEPPRPDFHERLSLVNDHPDLLRALGLVIDLRVASGDLARLRGAQWLKGQVKLAAPYDKAALPSAKTLVQVSGSALLARPQSESSDLRDGRLRLGDEARFAVLDLDPDASATKLDRFLWTLPRLLLQERKGEPAHAAPPTLRATGLTVVRSDRDDHVKQRVDGAATLDGAVAAGTAELHAEDLLRGYRVEVFDDSAHRWFSLHERKSEIQVGTATLSSTAPGFVRTGSVSETPGVDKSPLYVHESLFGWEGWSLSAPYPGRALHHESGHEVFDPAATTRPTPVSATHHAAPGTLPRLRYGRTYAFRAFTVDLAGNSVPHALRPATAQPQPAGVVEEILRARPRPAVADAPWLGSARAEVPQPQTATLTLGPIEAAEPQVRAPLTGMAELDGLLRERAALRATALERRGAAPTRREQIERTLAAVVAAPTALVADTAEWSAARLSSTALAHAELVESGLALADVAKLALDTVSRPRPFLRWEPVAPPTAVARRRFTEGESLRRLVVRSDVSVSAEGAVTVTPWIDSTTPADVHGYGATSERHLVPPKTTQNEAERHGVFDFAIASPDPSAHQRAFRMALRESGTLLDTSVPDLTTPSLRHDQPGIAALGPAGSAPIDLTTWPRGQALPAGRYIGHDTDALRVPWLPDPMAAGLTLLFPDANKDRVIRWPRNIESMSVRYGGTYPELEPYRLVLTHGAALGAGVDGSAIRVSLPPSDTLRLRASSRLDPGALDKLGVFRMLPEAAQKNPLIIEAAAEGWLWALTPSEEYTLVHAVPRPLEVPRPVLLAPLRDANSTSVTIAGALDCHGPSTDRIDADADWDEVLDDLNLAGPETQSKAGPAFGFTLTPEEDLVVLFKDSGSLALPVVGAVKTHRAVHALGDTKHRVIRYRFRATTRFQEYFAPETYTAERPPYLLSAPHTISVPASTPPARPEVTSVLPLFQWIEGPEPEQPFAFRRTRRVGLRLYLERPWFSSGAGEKLGVLLAPSPDAPGAGLCSEWGADPAWFQRGPAYRAVPMKHEDLVQLGGLDRTNEPAGPVAPPALLSTSGGQVAVLAYEPAYHDERRLWQVDVGLSAGAALWPFVRLVVARYQPDALPGCALSESVQCDFAQLPPERAFTLARPDERTARIVVSGPVGVNILGWPRYARLVAAGRVTWETAKEAVNACRRLIARLEQREPGQTSDLAWRELATVPLDLEGYDAARGSASWVGAITLPRAVAIVQPGQPERTDLRVTVEEIEILPADGEPGSRQPGTEERVVYADTIPL
ncbi:MAG: hypothetical protein U1A78_16120 [Polyangia bacterium]